MSLAEQVVLVKLKVSDFRGTITDHVTTEEVRVAKHAQVGANKATKYLLKDNDYFRECASATRALRTYVESITVPWEGGGIRALPADLYFDFGQAIREKIARFDAARQAFVANLGDLVAQDASRLGDLFDPDDYPSPDKLESMYHVEVQVFPIQNLDDIRVRLPEEEKAKMRADCEDMFADKMKAASVDLWGRLHKCIKRMVDNLDSNSRIYDTMIGNINDLVQILPTLNIGNDPELAYMTREITDRICSRYSTQSIKDSEATRKRARDDAQDVLDRIDEKLKGWG